jgi:histone acetyltransferase
MGGLTPGRARRRAVHKELKNHPSAWPFMDPVDLDAVPDYGAVVTEPMDLKLIGARIRAKHYASREQFLRDVHLMFDNCRRYNDASTVYYKHAEELQRFLRDATNYAPHWRP